MQRSMTAIFLALASVGALSLVAGAPAQAQQLAVSISLFHQELAPHGRWFQHPRYGWVWFPTTVDSQWRPYSHGQWVWTEQYGWYWNSDEAFGWATYHYGRWGYDEVYGWVWIPGTTWGPSWVAFRYSEGHVGWAPLPPETLRVSVSFNTEHSDMSAPHYAQRWVFVPRDRFLDARIYTLAAPKTQNTVHIRQSVNTTNYVTVNSVIVNRSIDRQRIETAIGRRIEVSRVRDVDDLRKSGRRGDTEIEVYRPQVRATPDAAPPEAARAKPGDKPRYVVHKDATAPSERRSAPEQPTPPGTGQPPGRPEGTSEPPRTDQERRGDDERRGATPQPAKPPAAIPGAPSERRGATPVQPAKPPAATPGTPDERRGATPAQPTKPLVTIPMAPDERRGETPVQPAKPPLAGPVPGTQPAKPPAKVTPSAPPSRIEVQPSPGATPPAKPAEAPKKVEDDAKKDEKKKDGKPGG
jgi:hypothetical protein